MKSEILRLGGLEMNHFTEFDAEMYCKLSRINIKDIKKLFMSSNNFGDISGIKLFKNLEVLHIEENNIIDLENLKSLKNLNILLMHRTKVINENTVADILNGLKKLEGVWCRESFAENNYIPIRKKLKNPWILNY